MLSESSKKFIDQLHPEGKVEFSAYDPASREIFEKVKEKIRSRLGEVVVEVHGSTFLEISGLDEIDIVIPVSLEDFDRMVLRVAEIFGEPTRRKADMVKFIFNFEGTNKVIDLSVANRDSETWKGQVKLEDYLKTHPEILAEYERIKQAASSQSAHEYYDKKSGFLEELSKKLKE